MTLNFLKLHINKKILTFICIGISLRLIYAFFFNHLIDITWHLAFARSVVDTGNLTEGFLAVFRAGDISQLHGKIWYQIISLWLIFLDRIHLLRIDFLLDTKPHLDPANYLVGFRQWSPPLYQLVSIKLFQFFWDIPLVYFLYRIAIKLKSSKPELIVLFWAINPFLMMVGYGIMTTEIAMLAALLGGIFYWLQALEKEKFNYSGIMSLILLSLGAVIKQLPLLFIPFVIMSLSRNWKQFIGYALVSSFSYFLFRQPWASDSYLFKQFFFFSQQSSGIFTNKIDNILIFFILYFSLIIFSLVNKKLLRITKNIIVFSIILISVVYFCDSTFFVQFLTWILPFTALLYLSSPYFALVFILSNLVVFNQAFLSHDYFSGLLTPAIGSGFNDYLHPKVIIDHVFNHALLDLTLNSVTKFTSLITGIILSIYLYKNKLILKDRLESFSSKFTFKKIVLFISILYLFVLISDFMIRSKYISLPQRQFQINWSEISLSTAPVILEVTNFSNKKITAVELPITRSSSNYDDQTIFEFSLDNKENFKIKIPDITLPQNSENYLTIFLPRPISASNFKIKIYKQNNLNKVILYGAKILESVEKPQNKIYRGYDLSDPKDTISLKFNSSIFPIYFRGQYDFMDIWKGVSYHFSGKQKLVFFSTYFIGALLISFLPIIYLYRNRINKDAINK